MKIKKHVYLEDELLLELKKNDSNLNLSKYINTLISNDLTKKKEHQNDNYLYSKELNYNINHLKNHTQIILTLISSLIDSLDKKSNIESYNDNLSYKQAKQLLDEEKRTKKDKMKGK